ncbi:unnamed protein product [Ostreobium quekettii]|uniref:Uncharacterized protein n=1 Tax=Ostreobium quekettii TaxID=121088 RepID=A0A8S1IYY1_9CHLO|nr:unnamed protein product [Ostreobium quekettii]
MELYTTIDSTFLYRWLRYADQRKLLQFDRLAAMLGNYLCDDAHCSYLSLETAAKFWRNLALAFPELIDFLAMSSEEDRGQFVHIVEVLYRNFFLTKQIGEDNLWSHIDWKDRAALMQWLAIASQEERQLFGSMIADGVRHNTADAAGERLARKAVVGFYNAH